MNRSEGGAGNENETCGEVLRSVNPTFLARPFSIACEYASANSRTKTSSPARGFLLIAPKPFEASPGPRVATNPLSDTSINILPTVAESKSTSCCQTISTFPSSVRDAYTGRAPTRIDAMS